MNGLALLLQQRGELAEAERWYRRSVKAAAHSGAMNGLALLLQQRGELAEAERWYRRSAEAGDREAMSHLALGVEPPQRGGRGGGGTGGGRGGAGQPRLTPATTPTAGRGCFGGEPGEAATEINSP
jgi:hypothetical protein